MTSSSGAPATEPARCGDPHPSWDAVVCVDRPGHGGFHTSVKPLSTWDNVPPPVTVPNPEPARNRDIIGPRVHVLATNGLPDGFVPPSASLNPPVGASATTPSAPLNAHGQLPSGLTLAALRERAVLFGGNGCEVPAPDLLCLLDELAEAREELAEAPDVDGIAAACRAHGEWVAQQIANEAAKLAAQATDPHVEQAFLVMSKAAADYAGGAS